MHKCKFCPEKAFFGDVCLLCGVALSLGRKPGIAATIPDVMTADTITVDKWMEKIDRVHA